MDWSTNWKLTLLVFICITSRQVQAVLQFTQPPTNQAALLNQALWWHCTARASIGSAEPSYSWVKGGSTVIGAGDGLSVFSNGTLYVEQVTQDVLGSYQCRVQSGVQRIESDVLTLALASLGLSFQASPTGVTQNLGSALSLQCSIASIPMATITWQLNGEDITMTTDITTSQNGGLTTSNLNIPELDHGNGGSYRCLAANHFFIGLTRFSQSAEVNLIGRPGFFVTPEPITVIIGGTATFECETNGSPSSTVDWLNPQDNVIISGNRFTATSTRLTITNTQQSDGGYYTCRATNAWGENTATALLTVTDPTQQIIFTVTPSDQSVVVGGRVTFPCGASGSPTPSIEWRKEVGDLPTDRIQEPAAGWLRITGVQVIDSGFYVCTASNSITSVSTRVQLVVQVAPSFITMPNDTTVETEEAVLLDCEADGMPTPAITWNTPLPELGILRLSSGLQFGVEVLSNGSLAIPDVENRHAGTYICSASNTVSSSSISASLTVRSSPVITSSPTDQTAIEGDMARFECRAAAVPTPVISWFFNGQRLLTDIKFEVLGNGDLRINNVDEDQEGAYTCSAGNELGVRNVSAYLTVLVPPQFTVHLVDLMVDPGSKVTLNCEASGDPMPSIQWQKDGSALVLETNIEVLSNSSVVIDGLLESNTGEYTCIATNIAGSNQVTATISTPDVPKFTTPPSNTTGNETQPISITCRADARETPLISWYLSDANGYQGDRIGQGINPPTTRAALSFVSVDGDLELTEVTRRDAGWYLCVAENSAGRITGTAYLSVNVPPMIINTNTPVTAIEQQSAPVLLRCDFDGQPTPDLSWVLPNGDLVPMDPAKYSSTIQGDSAYLLVYNPNVFEHDGDFMCLLSNFLGSANTTVQVAVQGAPVLSYAEAIPSGPTSVTLRCITRGSPAPSVTWQRGTAPLPDPSVTGHSVLTDGSLVIAGQSIGITDVYTCTATNPSGSVTATLQAPGQVATPSISDITSNNVHLAWATPPPTSDLSITSYTVQYQAESSDEYLLAGETGDLFYTVEGLQPYTGYQFRVQAVNGLGAGPFSPATSLIYTLEGAPSRPRGVAVTPVGNLLTVTWVEPARLNGNPDDIVYEIIAYPTDDENDVTTVTISHNSNQLQAIVDGLEYVTDYEVRVRAGNTALGEWSRYVTVQTRTGFQAPMSPIQDFSASANSSSTIWLTWQPTTDATFQAYYISYRLLNSSDMSPDVVLTAMEASSYLIIGLPSLTPHALCMAYQNSGGLSPYTQEIIVTTLSADPVVGRVQGPAVDGGIIAAIVCGILAVILILALLSVGLYCKRKNDDWSAEGSFNVDSLWINRRGGSQKGVYDLSMVNENFVPDETGLSSDSAYDLGGAGGEESGRKGESMEVSPRSEVSEGDEKKKKKRRWRGLSDVIYKNPDNPGVVLVSQAVIADTYPPPVPVNKEEVLSEDEGSPDEPRPLSIPESPLDPDSTFDMTMGAEENIYTEVGDTPIDVDNHASPHSNGGRGSIGASPQFPVFPNADDSVKLSDGLHIDRKLMRKMERKAEREEEKKARKKEREEERERRKELEREEKERERMFGGRRASGGLGKLFKRKKSDEIPYHEDNYGISTERQVQNAGMF